MAKAQIIVNLGAPSDFSRGAAENFLGEFLSDPYILPLPGFLRRGAAHIIARRRAERYVAAAKSIAVGGEFPVVHYTESLAEKVRRMSGVPTYAAFCFGRSRIADVVSRAMGEGFDSFRFIPAYPQNSLSMTQSAKISACSAARGADLKFLDSYCSHPLYIGALAESLSEIGDSAVVASFHSVPLSHLKGSPYASECEKTVGLLCEKTGRKNMLLGWQSKMGKGKWLEPSTEEILRKIAARGVRRVAVVCPGFSCDCTETLVEICAEARASFLESGGKDFTYCPCLNDSDAHAEMFCKLFEEMK